MPKWTIVKEFDFAASHCLTYHDGKCANLHGHTWKLRVYLHGDHLISEGPKTGMLVDYGDVSKVVKPLIEQWLDHKHLNDLPSGGEPWYPTSERLAEWMYFNLLPDFSGRLAAIEVQESPTSWCRYEL